MNKQIKEYYREYNKRNKQKKYFLNIERGAFKVHF